MITVMKPVEFCEVIFDQNYEVIFVQNYFDQNYEVIFDQNYL